jgi:hypothetical protein
MNTNLLTMAAPRGGSPVPARHTLPGQLRLRRALITALALATALTGFLAYRFFAQVVQTLGRDAVPSIVAAEQIRTTLADAHTQLMNVFLAQQGADGTAMQAYRQSIAKAHDHLLTAGQNITYGDDERQPILAAMTLLSDYERLVGLALGARGYSDALGQADALMRERLLPAVIALDQANFRHLDAAYAEEQSQSRGWLIGLGAMALLLVAALAETQRKLFAAFRRIVNPALAAGTAVFVVAALVFAVQAGRAMEDIRSAKEDAFDSVHALSQAQAVAYAANASESVYLLLHGRDGQAQQAALFQAAATRMFSAPLREGEPLPADLGALKGHGFLANALANITYAGEKKLAREELARWQDYVRIDRQIRALEAAGQHAEAVALCLGTQPQQSDWAFAQFMAALGATLKLNEEQFGLAIARASSQVQWLLVLSGVMLLAPLAGSLLGLQRRLAEFRA